MPTDISAGNLQSLFSDAYQWLCRSRKRYPPSSDIWQFRRDWKHQAQRVMDRFIQGRHQFAVQQRVTLSQGDTVADIGKYRHMGRKQDPLKARIGLVSNPRRRSTGNWITFRRFEPFPSSGRSFEGPVLR